MPDGFTVPASMRNDDLATEIIEGLTCSQKHLPPKLFYDHAGCALFDRITHLPEYYPTRTEHRLLAQIAATSRFMLTTAESRNVLVEYGACDEGKARHFLNMGYFSTYVPIDIASDALLAMQQRLQTAHPNLDVFPIAADFMRPITLPAIVAQSPVLGFFPGSTIGNLAPGDARRFLRMVADDTPPGSRLLIGVDLVKDHSLLLPAYDDDAGVTAQFNLNMLHRLNRDFGADFEPDRFRHRAIWNEAERRIEMHLVSLDRQVVNVLGRSIAFQPGETIHTENSYKYTIDTFQALATASGWTPLQSWRDSQNLFSVHLLTTAADQE